jgi:hypothetical protein
VVELKIVWKKFAFLSGIFVFTGASLLGGFANTQTLLIAGRAAKV